ncbi:response regulator [Sphingomonas sp. IW22]|uniref:response regulator n=1 Tax=Sphingomonas sp. IW22 TaxID=3242489 RepID=UPI0035229199
MSLTNCRILVVEDEFMVAHDLQLELEEAGAVILGPEASIRGALKRIDDESRIDAVVLDINLEGKLSFVVADAMKAKQIPFIFASGYEDEALSSRYPNVINCRKPFVTRDLLESLIRCLNGVIKD